MYIGRMYKQSEIEFNTLTQAQMRDIHSKACRILEEVGMIVHHEGALKLLRDAGAHVEGEKVFIPTAIVENAIRTAPSKFTLYDRQGRAYMFAEQRNVYYGGGSDTLNLIDYDSRERRKWTKQDVADGIRLCDALENIDFVMSMGVITDVPVKMNYREQYAAMIRNTNKPQVVVCDDAADLQDIIDMAAAVRGSAAELRRLPYFAVYCEPSSPLTNSVEAIDKLILCAQNDVPTNYAGGGLSGGTTPVTAAGSILLNTAECLLGLVITQLVHPGAPFLFGCIIDPMDMQSMQALYGHPTEIQIQGGTCDMARFYNLPSWGAAGCGCSKICDEQSSLEDTHYIMMAALQGCNIAHDVGYVDFGLSYSFENLVMCDEIISRTKAIFKDVNVDEDYLGFDAIARVGHGGNYLVDEHTLKHLREDWRGELSDFSSYDTWKKNGGTSMGERIHAKTLRLLAEYRVEPLPELVDRQIEAILEKARNK